jgi:anti-anti-sigma regulatory factor
MTIKEDVEIIINADAVVVIVREGYERGQLLSRISIEAMERPTIIFDFNHTTHLTSAFIADLIAIHEAAAEKGFKMLVCGVNKLAGDIFSSIGLQNLFNFSLKDK